MELSQIFKKDRETVRQSQIDSAKESMHEAGSLFDETVLKLNEAKRKIDEAQEQCAEEIQYHQEQIRQEEETSRDLERRGASVEKVIENVKTLFTFEDLD